MKLNREEAIKAVRAWNELISQEREPHIDKRPDADDLTHAITGGNTSWRIAGYITRAIMDFAENAHQLKIDLGYRETAALLVDCILENVPGISEEKETDLSGIAAGSPEAVMALARG